MRRTVIKARSSPRRSEEPEVFNEAPPPPEISNRTIPNYCQSSRPYQLGTNLDLGRRHLAGN